MLTALKMVIMTNTLFPWNFSDKRVFDHWLVPQEYRGRRFESKVMAPGTSYIRLNPSLFSLRVPKMCKKVNVYIFKVKGRLYELV